MWRCCCGMPRSWYVCVCVWQAEGTNRRQGNAQQGKAAQAKAEGASIEGGREAKRRV